MEAYIDQTSIQAGGKGNYIITDVQYQIYNPELQTIRNAGDTKYNKTLRQLNDSIENMYSDFKELTIKKEALTLEKGVLLNNRLYKGESKKDSLELLKNGLVFLREKLNNINIELLKIEKQESVLNKKKEKIENRINEINNELSQMSMPVDVQKTDYRIVVDVIADAATPAIINVNYYVNGANWTPIYDLRTDGVESSIKLTYKALVKQNTGADWKDVRLTLSTGNPKQSFNIPNMSTWYLGATVYNNKGKAYKKEIRK
ncbi:MAG: mucoidy inhibitor MuiA family protein [Bacteroidetes bacterium]|nr:mucoidy inhibitor MuiA family protein [Bacteroidota bacterium]